MRQAGSRFAYGRTLNYNHTKPYIPPPPALPRFPTPDEGAEEPFDPLDAAATAQRPALDAGRARRVIRRKPQADATEEVQVEDILLELYAEDPPPPTRRSAGIPPEARPPPPSQGPAPVASLEQRAQLSAQSAAVDALLRASDPAFAPFAPPMGHAPMRHAPVSAYAYPPVPAYAAFDQESPSVAPVAFPSMHMQLSTPVNVLDPTRGPTPSRVRPAKIRGNGGAALVVWTVLLLVLGVGAGTSIAVAVHNGTYARLRDSAKSIAARARSKPAAAAPAAAAPAAPPAVAAPNPVADPAPPPVPTVAVSSLPQSEIPADSAIVTFPSSAQGHRVFFDGRVLAVTGEPMKLRCGRHLIRIGGAGKARVIDLACGREVALGK